MITTLTLNPCIDKTITFEDFKYGGTHRVQDTRLDISGKGINVSIVLSQLSQDTICLGFNYTDGGNIVVDFLNKKNIPNDFVMVKGELRTNVKAFDDTNKVMTEFNENGRFVDENSVDEFLNMVDSYLTKTNILVLSGSVPAGVPSDIYKRIIQKANSLNIKTILDADGELLIQGLQAKPYLIKPNINEFEKLCNRTLETKEEIIQVAKSVIDKGIKLVCVSMGKDGALLISKDEAYYSKSVDIKVKGIQGSGDSLVAGMCIALEKGLGHEEMLHYGVAVAHGSLLHEGTQLCSKSDFERMYKLIKVDKI